MSTTDIQLRAVLDASSALKGVDRAMMATLPAKLVADLGGMVARWRLQRGLSDEPASATDLAMMILSLPGIGQAVRDAYLKGTGIILRVSEPGDPILGIPDGFTMQALDPRKVRLEDAPEEQLEVGQGGQAREGEASRSN